MYARRARSYTQLHVVGAFSGPLTPGTIAVDQGVVQYIEGCIVLQDSSPVGGFSVVGSGAVARIPQADILGGSVKVSSTFRIKNNEASTVADVVIHSRIGKLLNELGEDLLGIPEQQTALGTLAGGALSDFVNFENTLPFAALQSLAFPDFLEFGVLLSHQASQTVTFECTNVSINFTQEVPTERAA